MICTVMRYVRSAQWANSHSFELKWEYITNFLLGATICGADDDGDDDDGDRTGNDRKENEECGNH